MSLVVTLEIPEDAARRAREIVARTQRRFEDVLVEWIDQSAAEPPVESLSDAEVLALCDLQLSPGEQAELSNLLANNREGRLTKKQLARLGELMDTYERGMVRKSEALKVAVKRGLRPPLG